MIKTYLVLVFCGSIFNCNISAQSAVSGPVTDRELWLSYLEKVARPVIMNVAEDKLKERMPVELAKNTDNAENRGKVAYLEAFGRTLSGLAPWLNAEGGSKQEMELRAQYRQLSLRAIKNAVNPLARDYMLWKGGQPLVDASFAALALIRCPWLWDHLDTSVRRQVIKAFQTTRSIVPVYSNWILFSAMIEAFFCKYGYEYDPVRIEYAIREFANHWYIGDGVFSDGMNYHWDYYNSIVIHPFLANILDAVKEKTRSFNWFTPKLDTINKRYAVILERMVNSDGSFPITGRSIVYRGAAFHHLSDIALRKKLPHGLSAAQVRSALTAVIKKTLESPFTFNKDGWLNIGLHGNQPGLADFYITTGSLYICMNIFAALGLPETDTFWKAPAEPWTSMKVWSGQDFPADHALDLR